MRHSAALVRVPSITSPDVSTHLSARLNKPVGWTSLRHRLARSPDPTGAPSQSEVRRTFRKASLGWFLVPSGTGLQLMQLNNLASTKYGNKKCDNCTFKKFNPVVSHPARPWRLCAFTGGES